MKIEEIALGIKVALQMHAAHDEIEAIKNIDGFEAQGYASAPLICKMTGVDPATLLATVEGKEFTGVNGERDKGVKRWCKEQLGQHLRIVK